MLKKILVIDDQSLMHRVYAAALESCVEAGLVLLDAWDGAAGLRLLREHPDTDLILLDLEMPVMDGLEFLGRRVEEGLNPVPVIVCSGTADPTLSRRALELGATAFLQKPFRRAELYQTIVDVLRLEALDCL